MDDFAEQVTGVGALTEPVRRGLYRWVVAQPGPVSRDQAAAGAGVARHTAKFHLDKLVADGLLDIEYRRLTGRTGPGAGRPAKLYRRADRQLAVSLPPRRYDLAGQILAAAVDAASTGETPLDEAVRDAAAEAGRRLAGEAGGTGDALLGVLESLGYEPRTGDGTVELANCPFHDLAREHPALVCGLNLHLLTAVLERLGHAGEQAVLDPAPGRCCVRVVPRG